MTDNAQKDYDFWKKTNKKKLNRINTLISACKQDPYTGIGKPEKLKYNLANCISRRIDKKHRFVYTVQDITIIVLACRYHYDK